MDGVRGNKSESARGCVSEENGSQKEAVWDNGELLEDALTSGVDLREYSKQVETDLKYLESETLQTYINNAEKIATLHNKILEFDNTLANIENMLGAFKSNLSSISSEIESLQSESVTMALKLKNRQAVRGELSQLIDEVAVSEEMSRVLIEEAVTERCFMEQLHELKHKLDYLQHQDIHDAVCCVEASNILSFLRTKVVEKIREFLLKKIYLLRKPMANYQILGSSMLKYRFYFEFLVSSDRRIADEIRAEYADTMSKVLYTYFKTYVSQLMKLQLDDVATKDDLLGGDDSNRTSGIFSTRQNLRSATVFTLGTRASAIESDIEAPIIVPHSATQNSRKFHFEVLFRSAAYAILDNACREYLFLCDFFMVSNRSACDLFNQVMSKAIMVVMKNVETHVANSYDCIALTLCVRIVYHFQALAIERHVAVTDGLWEALLKVLLLRLNLLFKANADSLRNTDIPKLLPLDKRPHYIIRRYAEFYAALRDISSNFSDPKLQQNLSQLENEVNTFLMKCVKYFNTEKDKLIFYINNYDVICTIVSERIPEEQFENQTCRKLLFAYINEYVELLISNYFGELVRFVNIGEPLAEANDMKKLELNAGQLPSIAASFNNDWKKNVERINQEIMTSFSNFRNGTSILQSALTLLIHYHQRFQKLISLPVFASNCAKNKLINIHHLKVEMRKYKPTF